MNYHDSERMTGMLEAEAYNRSENNEDADVFIINTCAVREKPERKLFGELYRIKRLKENNPDLIVAVTGCMAPRDADVIRQKAPFVDILLGPRSINRLPDLIARISKQRQQYDFLDLADNPATLTPVHRSSTVSAWVDIMFGCNFSCAYCAVPMARGRELSRKPIDILNEVKELKYLGYGEITLLGQTVNAYGRDFRYQQPPDSGGKTGERIDFTWLLKKIDSLTPGFRVRFASPHPQFFDDNLIETMAEVPSVCEHVHLPMQSGSNNVLKRMRRSYSIEDYIENCAKLRKRISNISITTDIIVGFPGETEEDFNNTLQIFKELKFEQAFMFSYSPRRHTEAFDFKDEVPVEESKARLHKLIEIANTQFNQINQSHIGDKFEVLVDGISDKNPNKLSGRTRNNKTVVFNKANEIIGTLVKVKVNEAFLWGFKGVSI